MIRHPLVILIVVAALVWWQWDRITKAIGSGPSVRAGNTLTVQVLEYRCESQTGGGIRIDGYVRNTSDVAIGLRAVTAIYDASDRKSDYRESVVRPSPLQPGQEGTWRDEGPSLPDHGSCRLDSIVDPDTGRPVHLTRSR